MRLNLYAVEKKMANMKEITPKEHTIFTESQDLSEKLSFLTEEMKLMVFIPLIILIVQRNIG